jgi:DNA-binding IclR family transcriptional regulator
MTRGRIGPKEGGYRLTHKNREMLRKFKAGKSIGFTWRSSLKAKGLLPRSNGSYRLGAKYSETGREKLLTRHVARSAMHRTHHTTRRVKQH